MQILHGWHTAYARIACLWLALQPKETFLGKLSEICAGYAEIGSRARCVRPDAASRWRLRRTSCSPEDRRAVDGQRRSTRPIRLFCRRGVTLGDIVPIDQVLNEGLQIVRPAIAIIDVIGVLPDIDAEDRSGAMDEWAFAIGRLHHGHLAVLDRKPGPARSELRHAGLDEIFLHLVERTDAIDDGLFDLAGDLAAAIRLHPFPEMKVVVVLPGIVEEAGILPKGALDDLLEALAFPFCTLEQVVAVGDIGLM